MKFRLCLLSCILLAGSLRAIAADTTITLTALTGLKFDPARFVVEPGARVTIVFNNPDDMMHNFVVVRPGARLAVVEAALALGEQGPAVNFIPPTENVIASMPIVNPAGTGKLTFTAPEKEGVYPYVCTFPGHGFVMFGAMYVGKAPKLPPIAEDPNVPAPVVAAAATVLTKPTLQRTFLPDSGPATIAVGLPGGLAYCFDAAQCRLRYAWRGGFIDNSQQILGKGDIQASVVGRVYYRAGDNGGLHVSDAAKLPVAKWKGTRIVRGQPQLNYILDGAEVLEMPGVSSDGKNLTVTYEIANASGPVTYLPNTTSGAKITSTAGTWRDNRLTLTPAEAKRFTLTFTELPGVEPLAYWSMNDLIFGGRKDPLPGVIGRAFTPGGNLNRWEVLDTGIKLSTIFHAGTLMSWVKLAPPPAAAKANVKASPKGPVFSAGEGEKAFTLTAPETLARWQHVTGVLQHGTLILFVDGKEVSRSAVTAADPEATLRIGSLGKKEFLTGLLDEVRIYDRALSPEEIDAIYQREKPKAGAKTASQ